MRVEMPSSAGRNIDYRDRPTVSDFAYYTTSITGVIGENTLKAIEEVKGRFGIDVKPIPWGEIPEFDGRLPYVLVDTGAFILPTLSPEDQELVKKFAELPDSRVNLIGSYTDDRLLYESGYGVPPSVLIPNFDRRFGVNTIFADYTLGAVRTNSARDIADNIVCETIRAKVLSSRDSSPDAFTALQESQGKKAAEIEVLRRIYEKHGLWHRSPTDGAVVFRTESGFLVSQTRTDKTGMNPDNFSFIHDYSKERNSVTFTGKKIPTSDVEIVVALDKLKEKYRMAIHFHKNSITRKNGFNNHKTSNIIEYGIFDSADEIINELERIGDNWLILKEHGVLWLGDSLEDFEKFIAKNWG